MRDRPLYYTHTHTAFALCSSYMDSACSTPAVSYLLYATNLCVDLTLDEAEPSSEYATCSSLCEWETDRFLAVAVMTCIEMAVMTIPYHSLLMLCRQ